MLSKGNKVKKLLKVLATGLASIGLVIGLNAGVAYAHADGPTLCAGGACVWFKHDGDYIHVKDSASDGHSAVAQVCSEPSSCSYAANYIWNHSGSGTTFYYGYGTQIPEGADVYYRPCYGEWNGGGGDEDVIWCNPGWTHGTA